MTPILYSANERAFDSNGIGALFDLIDITVESVLNGIFELEMQYPITGKYFSEIQQRSIIVAEPDPVSDPQPFRVYRISKPLNGVVTIYGRHLAYDLDGIVVSPFSAGGAPSALQSFKTYATTECPFNFWTDKTTSGTMDVVVPMKIWSLLGGSQGSILDVYGGEYEFDRFDIKLHNKRGADRGVSIRYGKNLTSLEQDENCSSCYTGVYPYWAGSEAPMVQLPEKIVYAEGEYGYIRIMPLDLSQEWDTAPTEEQLRTRTKKYIKDNKIGVPHISWKVEFVQLEQTEEYKGTALLERVSLGDTVTIDFAQLKVSATARVSAVRYKPVLERYESVTLGSVKANITDTIVHQQHQIEKAPTMTDIEKAQAVATAWLTNGKGYKVERRDANGNTIDTLYLDSPDINTAVNVLRIGQSGIGFSHSGVNGPYVSAWTIDGHFNADFITTGSISANIIKSGVITSADGSVKIDLSQNKVTVETLIDGRRGRIELTANGIFGYGYNKVENIYYRTLKISPGGKDDKMTERFTEIDSGQSNAGLAIGSRLGSDVLLGGSGSKTKLIGSEISIDSKVVSWKPNGDGTFSLIGR